MTRGGRQEAVNAGRRRLLRAGLAGGGAVLVPGLFGCGSSSAPGGIGSVPGKGQPHGVHVSFTDDPATTRTATWFTDGLDTPGSVMEYGPVLAGKALDSEFPGWVEGSTEQAYGVDVLTHRATATGIDPGLPLRYRVGDGTNWSPVRVLAPKPSGKFRFAHFGDHGSSEFSRLTVQRVLERSPDFFLLAGDLSYANGDQTLWNPWFDQLEPLAANVPMMVAPGNHEDEDNGGLAYKSRTSHPGNGTFYSFDYNNVHFLVSTAGCLVSDGTLVQELLMMELDLAQAALRRAAGEIDFIVLVQHFTIWTDEEGRSPANPTLVALEENMLLLYGVDLLIDAHDHSYQRSVPMLLGLPNPLGYVQVVAGGGGVGIRTFSGQSAWSGSQALRYHFVEYEVDGPVIRGTTYATDTPEQQPASTTEIIDQFEIPARSLLARKQAVHPVRSSDVLLANFDRIEAHTRLRNARHLHKWTWPRRITA
jgi:hypothetical protein